MRLAALAAMAACTGGAASDGSAPAVRRSPEELLALVPPGAAGVVALDHAQLELPLSIPGIVVRDIHGGSYAALRPTPPMQSAAAAVMPELARIEWIAVELSPSRVLSGAAMFPDARTAAAVAVNLGMVKQLALTQLPGPLATALDKVAVTAWGPAVRISAVWTAADLSALAAR